MSDHWDFYFTNVDDAPGSIFTDLGIRDSVPDRKRPWLLWCVVDLRDPNEDGFPGDAEATVLRQLERAISRSIERASGAEMVGRISTAGRRAFYFHGPRTERFKEAVDAAMTGFSAYVYKSGFKEDADWSYYLDCLYPSPDQLQQIRNNHTIELLQEKGDALTAPRPVTHWACFANDVDRDGFVAKAVARGFKVVEERDERESNPTHPAAVTLERIDSVDWESVNEVTMDLFVMAHDVGGVYDGWETQVVQAH